MQQVQDKLVFKIETPNDKEIAKRFADNQKSLDGFYSKKPQVKHKKRVKKNAKKLARGTKQFIKSKRKRSLVSA
jgi:hypothetical protein